MRYRGDEHDGIVYPGKVTGSRKEHKLAFSPDCCIQMHSGEPPISPYSPLVKGVK